MNKDTLEAIPTSSVEISDPIRSRTRSNLRDSNKLNDMGIEIEDAAFDDILILNYHPEYKQDSLTTNPIITLAEQYLLYQHDILTHDDLAKLSIADIESYTNTTTPRANCIKTVSENHANKDYSLANTVATKADVSAEQVTEVYDTLVTHTFTSHEQTIPDVIEPFLVKYYTNDDPTSIYAFDFLPLDLTNLLVSEGYTTTEDILEEEQSKPDKTPLTEIQYHNIYGKDNIQMGEVGIEILRRAAQCKKMRTDEVFHTKTTPPTISEAISMLKSHGGEYERAHTNKRVALTAVEAALTFEWGDEIVDDALRFFTAAKEQEIPVGGGVERVVIAALRIASLIHNEPTPFSELADIIGDSKADVRTKMNRIVSETDITDEIEMEDLIIDPVDCVLYVEKQLAAAIDSTIFDEIRASLSDLDVNGNSPWTETGAATYAAMISNEQTQHYTQEDVADLVSISAVSIRNQYKKYLPEDTKTETLGQ